MKKFLLLLVFCLSLAQVARSQTGPIFIDSLWSTPYICQANYFEVKIYGTAASMNFRIAPETFAYSNDTVYVNFNFVSNPGPAVPMPFSSQTSVPAPNIGLYKVLVRTFFDGTLNQTFTSTLMVCNGISATSEMAEQNTKILVFPNPARDQVMIRLPEGSGKFLAEIRDVSGKIINLPSGISGTNLTVHLNELPAGLYFFKLQTNGKVFTEKVLKL